MEELAEALDAVLVDDNTDELELEAEFGPGPDPPPAPPKSAIASEGWRPRLWDARREGPRFTSLVVCRASLWGRGGLNKEQMWLDLWVCDCD